MLDAIKKINTTRVLSNPIFIIGAVVFLYSPSMFNHLPIISTYDVFIKLLFVSLVFGCYLIRVLNGKKIDDMFILLNVFSAYQFIVTAINKGDVAGAVWLYWILSDALFLFVDMEMDDGDKILKYICYIFLGMMVINLFTVLRTPYIYYYGIDMNETYWFGNYNSFINYFLPEILISYYFANKSIGKVLFVFVLCTVSFTYYFARSLTSIVVLSVFAIYILFFNKKNVQKIMNFKMYFFILLVIFSGFVVSRVGEDIFSAFFPLVNKNSTLSGRTGIWSETIVDILRNPVWGYGLYNNNLRMLQDGYAHSHNLILEVLFRTGLVGGILYVLLWKDIWINIKNTRDIKIKGLLSMTFFVFWMRSQFETGNQLFLILTMSLLWKIPSIEKIKIKYNNI